MRPRYVLVIASLVALASITTYLVWSTPPPTGVFITTEGSVTVGSDLRVVVTVRNPALRSSSSQLTFLSLNANHLLEAVSADLGDDLWGSPRIWNLTGLDLSQGKRFVLDTTPVWAAEGRLEAVVWIPRGNLSAVRFYPSGDVDVLTIAPFMYGQQRVQTFWPLQLSVTADGNFTVGGELNLTIAAQGQIAGPRTPSLLYLSVETKPIYYSIVASTGAENPWGLANVWNLTGSDLSGGKRFFMTVSPNTTGARIPMEVRVWSPRVGWSAIQFTQEASILNLEAVFFWASVTVDFAIS